MIGLALLPAAFAGAVYINGVRADVLPEVTLSNVTVRFDAQGNTWVEAPGYRVQVVPPPVGASPGAPPSAPVAARSGVPAGLWWLVTEDNASDGQAVDVLVNGAFVRRVASGEPQMILDLAPWLVPGANTVLVNPVPGATAAGGVLNLYIGRGTNVAGTIADLDNPEVVHALRASAPSAAKTYTFPIP